MTAVSGWRRKEKPMTSPTNRLIIQLTPVIRLGTGVHRTVYRATGGRLGGRIGKAPIGLLTTTGRRSGQPRVAPLVYLADRGDWIVAASNGGRDVAPNWWANLRANTHAVFQIHGTRREVTAGEITGEERERLWQALIGIYSGYEIYRRKTTRHIPVIRLHPETSGVSLLDGRGKWDEVREEKGTNGARQRPRSMSSGVPSRTTPAGERAPSAHALLVGA